MKLMIEQREQLALEVYLKLLTAKVFDANTIDQRTQFLKRLLPLLAQKNLIGTEYKKAIETLMDFVDKADWPEGLLIAREYYPFWINDLKAVSRFNENTQTNQLPINWKPLNANLSELWKKADEEKFGTTDNWALKAYTKALRFENADQALIDTRTKLAKILLMRLKDAPDKSNQIYRTTVDATLPLFDVKKNRRLFLVVVREFFHFWAGNPDAEKFILNSATVNML